MNSLRATRTHITKRAIEHAGSIRAGRAVSATYRPVGAGISWQRIRQGDTARDAGTGIADHDRKPNRVAGTYR